MYFTVNIIINSVVTSVPNIPIIHLHLSLVYLSSIYKSFSSKHLVGTIQPLGGKKLFEREFPIQAVCLQHIDLPHSFPSKYFYCPHQMMISSIISFTHTYTNNALMYIFKHSLMTPWV